ncbi:MAG: ATP-binding protein [Candidatus Thorarchaeota archaeon]|nr:MAG: ATP-binding protein [Candidatus Thorarchaeota archaeon]
MTNAFEGLKSTADIDIPTDPFSKVIGQTHAVKLVKSAVSQRRHVLLCGVPGIGKSMIASAAYSLLPPPIDEIRIRQNPEQGDRPTAVAIRAKQDEGGTVAEEETVCDSSFMYPDDLPFEIAVKMGYRCSRCGAFSLPSQNVCMDCGSPKRCNNNADLSYQGLFRALNVAREPALAEVTSEDVLGGHQYRIVYQRSEQDMIRVLRILQPEENVSTKQTCPDSELILVSWNSSRFVQVSGASPVELLGDVKHDPYGSAEGLGVPAHMRVIPGAIHEAHEGVLYIDEIGALGSYQKHLLTAMQDRKYPILGHNPQSSGAAVRVDNVPCDFLLFASCNPEDLSLLHPALRSRIRGYGYEIVLTSWMSRNHHSEMDLIRFVAQTVHEDGRIPHFGVDALEEVMNVAESLAYRLDGQRNAFTLRLREIGGLVRIAGDAAVQEEADIVEENHVKQAELLCRRIEENQALARSDPKYTETFGDYFF